jgi:hypothetical protein
MLTVIGKTFTALALAAGALVFVTAAAQAQVLYVASFGDNANNCTRGAPCRTLQRAINESLPEGEVQILDSGTYGNAITITKSVTISAVGVSAAVGAVTINASGATVVLRGLILNGVLAAANTRGILISSAGAVQIEGCVIHGFADDGIRATAGGVKVNIIDSVSRYNGGDGLYIFAGSASRLTVDNSQFDNNAGAGIAILSGKGAVHRSSVSSNGSNGFTIANASVTAMWTTVVNGQFAGFAVGTGSTLNLEFSLAHGNGGYGLQIGEGGTARISNSTITGSTSAINNNGTLQSRGNNNVAGAVLGDAKVPIAGF